MHKNFWLIQLFLESINNKFFHRDLLVFPLILTKALAECPLIQPFFSYSFSLGAEVHKLIRKDKYSRNFQKIAILQDKHSRNTILF